MSMDYEEKYKEALERARQIQNTPYTAHWDVMKEVVEDIFPELAESEDDKIRKWLIRLINTAGYRELESDKMPCSRTNVIAWLKKQGEHAKFRDSIQVGDKVTRNQDGMLVNLSQLNRVAKKDEKQGEQEPQEKSALEAAKEEKIDNANKAEPKFKAGDWVVCGQYGAPCQIESIKNGRYYFTSGIGIPVENVNIDYHLWTIQEAKDGDVLCCEKGWTCIFKTLVNDETFSSYCFMDKTKWFCETGSECHTLKEEFVKAYNGKIYPATKEQRELLFQKMHEAGYEWDAEKKELKKIEQKSSWSEEDENKVTLFMQLTEGCDNDEELADWLKSLKDRVQLQPKQEWSEEDEKTIVKMRDFFIRVLGDKPDFTEDKRYEEFIEFIDNRLKSIRGRFTWNPSNEQMDTLEYYMHTLVCNEHKEILFGLYADLKKLKE